MAVDDFTKPQRRLILFMYQTRNPVALTTIADLFARENKGKNTKQYLRTVDRLERCGFIQKMTQEHAEQPTRFILTPAARQMAMFARDCLDDLGLDADILVRNSDLAESRKIVQARRLPKRLRRSARDMVKSNAEME